MAGYRSNGPSKADHSERPGDAAQDDELHNFEPFLLAAARYVSAHIQTEAACRKRDAKDSDERLRRTIRREAVNPYPRELRLKLKKLAQLGTGVGLPHEPRGLG